MLSFILYHHQLPCIPQIVDHSLLFLLTLTWILMILYDITFPGQAIIIIPIPKPTSHFIPLCYFSYISPTLRRILYCHALAWSAFILFPASGFLPYQRSKKFPLCYQISGYKTWLCKLIAISVFDTWSPLFLQLVQ